MYTYQNPREVYGNVLLQLAKNNPDIVALDADLCKSTMTCLIEQQLTDQYFEMGLGEQNMLSVAGGLSILGKIPFVNSFAVFLTSRAFDQVRQAIGISGLNVKIIGSSAGLSDFGDGSTHQSVEDIAIMRSIPGMTVIAPCDAYQLENAIHTITKFYGPVYLRYSRNNLADITLPSDPFEIGDVYTVNKGTDITLFAHGVMLEKALNAAHLLKNHHISVLVVNVPTLKPLNRQKIVEFAKQTGAVVTVEEHNIIGGLGSAVVEALRLEKIPVDFVAINDSYGISARNYDELLEHFGLTEENIINTIHNVLKYK